MSRHQNQQNPRSSNKKTVDANGNRRVKWAAKDNGTTMPLVEGLTRNGCKVLENKFRNAVEELGGKLLVHFVDF